MIKHLLLVGADLIGNRVPQRKGGANARQWTLLTADTGAEALAIMKAQRLDVVVADYGLPDMTGLALLTWVRENCEGVLRLIASSAEDREEVLRSVLGQHHFLPKPLSSDALVSTIERVVALDRVLPNEKLQRLATRIRTFPPMPTLYFQVMAELKTLDYSAEKVGGIVAKDLAMTTRLLQVLNSGFYGMPRQITDTTEAVNLLGREMIKALIISIHVFLKRDNMKPLYFSINQVWRHSMAVAKSARQIALAETDNSELAEDAYTAGLLHDIGKLVLAHNFEQQYNEAQRKSRESGRPPWMEETELFGVSHAELGAFLLGRWGMPVSLLEAAALHHQPSRSSNREFTALTAVHVANALEQELRPGADPRRTSVLDLDYLASLGVSSRVEAWRESVRTGNAPAPPAPVPTPAPAPAPAQASKPSSSHPDAAPSVTPSPIAEPIASASAAPGKPSPQRETARRDYGVRRIAIPAMALFAVALVWFAVEEWQTEAPVTGRERKAHSANQVSVSTVESDSTPKVSESSVAETNVIESAGVNPDDGTNTATSIKAIIGPPPSLPETPGQTDHPQQ